jgi:hypothetical protein
MADEVTDTGWRSIIPKAEVVDTKTGKDLGAYGEIEAVTGLESRPCCMCKSFDAVDPNRLIRHILSKGLRPRADGKFESPIKDDFKGQARANMTLDPKGSGMCTRDVIIVEGLATCENWSPTRTMAEFQARMRPR